MVIDDDDLSGARAQGAGGEQLPDQLVRLLPLPVINHHDRQARRSQMCAAGLVTPGEWQLSGRRVQGHHRAPSLRPRDFLSRQYSSTPQQDAMPDRKDGIIGVDDRPKLSIPPRLQVLWMASVIIRVWHGLRARSRKR